MKTHRTPIPGLLLFEPAVYADERGYFLETWNERRYREAGFEMRFVQDNLSRSRRGVVRGFHYQLRHPQGKLVQVTHGEVYDVVVDVRVASPTYGRWFGVTLSEENHLQLYVPEGFAHAFCVVSEHADFAYKVTRHHAPGDEYGIRWDDPAIGVEWPLAVAPVLSAKDAAAPLLAEAAERALLPRWEA